MYTIKWKGYDDFGRPVPHSFLVNEPGGPTAIAAWQARALSVPAQPSSNRAARHLYRGPRPPAPSLLPQHPPVAVQAVPVVPPAAAPAPVAAPVPVAVAVAAAPPVVPSIQRPRRDAPAPPSRSTRVRSAPTNFNPRPQASRSLRSLSCLAPGRGGDFVAMRPMLTPTGASQRSPHSCTGS
jgi:hypothetical protein